MSDAFTRYERELLLAARNAAHPSFLVKRAGPNLKDSQTEIEIGGICFPSPWNKDEEEQYTNALSSLIDSGFATALDKIRDGVWRWSLTPKGASVSEMLASQERKDE